LIVGYGCAADSHNGATHPVAFMNITPDTSEAGFVQIYAVSPNTSVVHIQVMSNSFLQRKHFVKINESTSSATECTHNAVIAGISQGTVSGHDKLILHSLLVTTNALMTAYYANFTLPLKNVNDDIFQASSLRTFFIIGYIDMTS